MNEELVKDVKGSDRYFKVRRFIWLEGLGKTSKIWVRTGHVYAETSTRDLPNTKQEY